MKDFLDKINQRKSLTEEIERYIFPIFERYIKDHIVIGKGFTEWECRDNEISFSGYDTWAYGGYEDIWVNVPFDFFIDYDAALEKEKAELEIKNQEKIKKELELEENRKLEEEKIQRETYLKLKAKFEK